LYLVILPSQISNWETTLSHTITLVQRVKYLSDALKSNTTITALYLRYNNIRSEGVACLSDALKSNTTITTLSWNIDIDSEGVNYLSDPLKNILSHNLILGCHWFRESNTFMIHASVILSHWIFTSIKLVLKTM